MCLSLVIISSLSSCKRVRVAETDNDIDTVVVSTPETTQTHSTDSSNNKLDTISQAEWKACGLPISSDRNEIILHRLGYITSYNPSTKLANWVAWYLTAEHSDGPISRDDYPYMEDPDVPEPKQKLEDWRNTPGLDHGHMCPAADNKWSADAMLQSFYLTNMCPQNHDLNGGAWCDLENKCRTWARKYKSIYIIAGPIFYTSNHKKSGNDLHVPDAFYKVILCLDSSPKALGFIYQNNGNKQTMKSSVVSIDRVEEMTNCNFFSSLPDDVENVIEQNSNLDLWK